MKNSNVLLVAAMLACPPAFADTLDLTSARALLEAGKAAEAYDFLSPYEADEAGNQAFDYLLAVAALESGKPDKALLMFDRVLSVNPYHAGAHLDLGRAYFALKNDQAAQEQFDWVLAQNPPEMAKAAAEKYLRAIEQRATPAASDWTVYVEGGFGHDSNVNSSTSQSQVVIPALNNTSFTLNSNNIETSSYYFYSGAGLEFTHMLAQDVKLMVGGDLNKRNNPSASQFNSDSIAAHAGLQLGTADNSLSVILNKSRFYLDTSPNRDTSGATAFWQYTLNPQNQISLFGAYNAFRYVPNAIKNENIDQMLAGAGWTHAVDTEGKALLSISAYLGRELEDRHRADGNKDIRGLRLGGEYTFSDVLAVYGGLGAQYGDYSRENLAFMNTRRDWQYDGTVGLTWRIAEQWTVKPQLLYSRNNSNINLYDYDRADASVTVRWDFH